MASTGFVFAGTGASQSPGDSGWSNPTDITTSNNSDASCSLAKGAETEYLIASNFGFSIPGGSTINGVTVRVERAAQHTTRVEDLEIKLYVNGSITAQNKASGTDWPISDTTADYGGAADTWGESLTPTLVNASNFGVAVKAHSVSSSSSTAYVDAISIDITYTPGAGAAGRSFGIII